MIIKLQLLKVQNQMKVVQKSRLKEIKNDNDVRLNLCNNSTIDFVVGDPIADYKLRICREII